MDIARRLGEFVYGVDIEKVPEDVREKTKTCFMNALGVGISGWKLGPATHARRIAKEYYQAGPGKKATLFMDGAQLTVPGAIFGNIALFHSRAQEDTLGSCHNGTMIVPAALAVAENYDCSGRDVESAVLAGYEVTAALEKKLCKLTNPRGFRASALYVSFGVAAAAAKLMKLDEDGIADAIRICASFIGGIQESFAAGTTEWFYQNAIMGNNGVLAAQLAADGVPGAASAIDGVKGFMQVMAGTRDLSLVEEQLETLGQEWRIRDVTFKFNPCCAIAQTPFIATCELASEKDISPEDVEKIEYHMNPFESNYPGTKGKGPFKTDTQTTMSCAFNIANAIVNRKSTKKAMQVFDDPRILNIVDRVTVVDDENYPIINGKVVITLKDGTVYEKEMRITSDYYTLTWDQNLELMNRIHREVGIPEHKTAGLAAAVLGLDQAKDVSAVIEAVARI